MKTIKAIIILTLVSIFTTTTYAAEVPRELAHCNASNVAIVFVESFIGETFIEFSEVKIMLNYTKKPHNQYYVI